MESVVSLPHSQEVAKKHAYKHNCFDISIGAIVTMLPQHSKLVSLQLAGGKQSP
jgi:hypothetical protein